MLAEMPKRLDAQAHGFVEGDHASHHRQPSSGYANRQDGKR